MIKYIGTKIYYCNFTGNVIKEVKDMKGIITATTFDEDYETYHELNERKKDTIGFIQFEYGQYEKLSKDSTGVMVNLETKELIFTYEEIPVPPQEPTEIEKLQNKIDILEGKTSQLKQENADLTFALMIGGII